MRYKGGYYVKDRKVYRIKLQTSIKGQNFETIKDIAVDDKMNTEDLEFAEKNLKTIDPVRELACEGTRDQKERYSEILRSNRESITE
ncbi:hypothetical protein [Methylobacterium cerastii]|uniref:hypothetical protein n=1 Tax=Methylobacterium cerastii TaxID=932741 RepID=UPI001EE27038|nr:hypothetical protein [Methylobacterium cerastii]